MDYTKQYNLLIIRALTRTKENDQYYENHHIIPKCMGGDDTSTNLVPLTGREHYIAHLLLVKIYPKNRKLIFAANMMCNRNNRHYEWVRKQFSIHIKQQNKGQKVSQEARLKMSLKRKDVPKSQLHKTKIAEAHKQQIEYGGAVYNGFNDLESKTHITSYLYKKYYLAGIDPTPFIKNNTYGLRKNRSDIKPSLGKKWVNNGIQEKYICRDSIEVGWQLGRLKRNNVSS